MPPKKKELKGIVTPCSLCTFTKAMDKLKKKITKEQWAAVKRTPFSHFLKAKMGKTSVAWVAAILGRYDKHKKAFVLRDGVQIRLEASELCCVLGLHLEGQHVQQNLVLVPSVVYRYFEGNISKIERKNILKVLEILAGRQDVVEDFARVFVLLVFNCILFPTATGKRSTLAFLIHHVDNLDRLGQYAWGKATYRFLVKCIDEYTTGKRYMAGCTIGLVAWFFERVPELGTPIRAPSFPRFTRWAWTHPNMNTCKIAIAELTGDDVENFYPLPEEVQFLHAKPVGKEKFKKLAREEEQLEVEVEEEEEDEEDCEEVPGDEVEENDEEEEEEDDRDEESDDSVVSSSCSNMFH